jgi:hypothetical protein
VPPAVLLVEVLGPAGSDAADTRLRASVLRHAGYAVREVVLPASAVESGSFAGPLVATHAQAAPRTVVIAAPRAAAGTVLAALPAADVRWWPTGLEDPAGPLAAAGRAAATLFADGGDLPALEAAPLRPPVERERVSLWDGDYVLVPAPLDEAGGAGLLAAFAGVAEDEPGLDLVVLADPQPRFARRAGRLGISTRVHFAGPAPRTAEHTWLASASAALIPAGGPVAASLILRALAAGCPLLPAGGTKGGSRLAAWLAARGCLPATAWRDGGDTAGWLASVLEPDAATRRAVERGRSLVPSHQAAALAVRIARDGGAAEPAREVA